MYLPSTGGSVTSGSTVGSSFGGSAIRKNDF